MAESQRAVLEPHLTDVARSGSRYPNPFFDLGQQYQPRTVKELFQWCSFFYYSNPLVGATITKISRYPITDLVVEDPDVKIKEAWQSLFDDTLHIKDRMMETNLDLNVYGNAFVSLYLPFTRFLICQDCGHRTNIKDIEWTWSSYCYSYICPKCKSQQRADPGNDKTIKDVPYRAKEEVRVIRWNPENIILKYNEATARTTYYYNLSYTLKWQIQQGEKDILEDMPLLFILAVKHSRIIKLSTRNIFHLKRPTLAEKDMGWGKPLVYHVLKDLYYMATLRKAQEAIANEHIVPFDMIYPTPNAQMDPFVHTDLGSWKVRVEEAIKKHRFDPNYKAVFPVPVGHGRLGGEGKALMLTPELNYLNQVVVGGMGIPIEFLMGGLNWTGSSITLRSLQNDFLHNQTQLLDLVMWMKEKMRIFLRMPDCKKLRFLDFKMADDIQRIQQFIALNASNKISDDTMLTELGLDYEKEQKKMFQELQVKNQMQDLMAKAQAKTSGEAQLISFNYQEKMQELQMEAQKKLNNENPALNYGGTETAGGFGGEQSGLAPQNEDPNAGQPPEATRSMTDTNAGGSGAIQTDAGTIEGTTGTQSAGGQNTYFDVPKMVKTWATKLSKLEPIQRDQLLSQIKQQMPMFGKEVEEAMKQEMAKGMGGGSGGSAGQANPNATAVSMNALPEKGAPTRAGSA
jgi:hypothetical protein